ncbi:hypothetical protein PCC7424_5470 (plasmid) [Gloeothece citriformis PCC 7424]|uniref:Uncharacterized protein n=1 Tax=Gloeothece citriformis (strain PCC 7424) TaxID=65393 RepID=B7KLR6_GLOC7|nr:hypothetical protein [Gloeothece citriformis]ACK73738.1 hypothetical protein PCC7424_5671 [Gloeothece citriformis PCC 7424]ACK74041.1 hypothetical protein PCC7424_5470 [Gloeothece citriformis PCC 7424]
MSQQNEEKPLNSESLICDLIEDETLKTEMLNDIICIVSALNYSHFKIDSKEQVY